MPLWLSIPVVVALAAFGAWLGVSRRSKPRHAKPADRHRRLSDGEDGMPPGIDW